MSRIRRIIAAATLNEGQCSKSTANAEFPYTKEESREVCKEAKPLYNPGHCSKEGLSFCEILPFNN
jgi:hypothetical protein